MAPARKPLFSKPAWASKRTSSTEDLDQDVKSPTLRKDEKTPIFSSKHIYEDIVAQERKRREKHAQKVKEREEKERLKLTSPSDAVKVGNSKRRRVSNHDQRNDESTEESGKGSDSDTGGENEESSPARDNSKISVSTDTSDRRNRKSLTKSPIRERVKRKRRSAATDVISLEAASDDGNTYFDVGDIQPDDNEANTSRPDPESEEEDDYLRELKRKAREQARLKKLGVAINGASLADDAKRPVSSDSNAPGVDFPMFPEQGDQQSFQRDASRTAPDDPEVNILIDTIIPNAKPLVVSRRASQPLEKVKEFWCQRNGLNPAIASKVFFTWRGTRLYKASTSRGILETLKRANPKEDDSDPSNGKITLEAVTDEIFEHRRNQQERRRREAAEAAVNNEDGSVETGPNGFTAEETAEVNQVERSGVVIRLVCPEVEAMDIRLRPHTTVSKVIAAFCRQRGIDSNRKCWLSYDGERLEENQTAEEIGFDMNDCVDVYLR